MELTDTTVVSLLTFAAVVVGQFFATFQAERRRRWEKEDREEVARALALKEKQDREAIALALLAHNAALADTLAQKVIEAAKAQKQAIAENTEISKQAFHEANSVNLKIAELGRENNALMKVFKDAFDGKIDGPKP